MILRVADFLDIQEVSMKLFNLVMVLLCVAFFSASVSAAVFLKFEGVDGESSDANHDKWIDVLSIDWGMHKPTNATGQSRRRGGVIVEDMRFTTNFNLASPALMRALAIGQSLPSAEIHFVQTEDDRQTEDDQKTHVHNLMYRLTNVQITGYESSVGEDGLPVESFSFNFEEVVVDYLTPDGEGGDTFSYSRREGR